MFSCKNKGCGLPRERVGKNLGDRGVRESSSCKLPTVLIHIEPVPCLQTEPLRFV